MKRYNTVGSNFVVVKDGRGVLSKGYVWEPNQVTALSREEASVLLDKAFDYYTLLLKP